MRTHTPLYRFMCVWKEMSCVHDILTMNIFAKFNILSRMCRIHKNNIGQWLLLFLFFFANCVCEYMQKINTKLLVYSKRMCVFCIVLEFFFSMLIIVSILTLHLQDEIMYHRNSICVDDLASLVQKKNRRSFIHKQHLEKKAHANETTLKK